MFQVFGTQLMTGSVTAFIMDNRWIMCQLLFAVYMSILAIMDIKWKKLSLSVLLSGFIILAAGLLCGMDRVKSARYSFLLSIPVILLAALYHCVKVTGFEELKTFNWGLILLGSVLAAVVGYACIKYFLIFLGKRF